ncbi:MAG: D-alanyl-D-alanine carboxypeptidase/D-alanyl-D-alanine-endopeptidase [Actinomycetota bacterium]
MRRAGASLLVSVVLLGLLVGPAHARAAWKLRIDRLVAGKTIGVAVREQDRYLYKHQSRRRRVPASNQKLLLSMALFDRLEPERRIETSAATAGLVGPVIEDDLWLLGRGDPTVSGGGHLARELPFEPTRLGTLAREIRAAGVTRIDGRVIGSTGYFARDWWAHGWEAHFPSEWIPLPTALSFEGNQIEGRHIADPEIRAARSLTQKLRDLGVSVTGRAAAGVAPSQLTTVASVSSVPLQTMVRYMNRRSSNFFSEVFGKRVGLERSGFPGTIAKGAAAIEAWAKRYGVALTAYDSSGLSYENRVSPNGLVRLLDVAEDQTWGVVLRNGLPGPNEGTLEDRLNGVRVRAKTGSLTNISTLSGYVWLRERQTWAEFSIMSRGMSKTYASAIEDDIVRILTRAAR